MKTQGNKSSIMPEVSNNPLGMDLVVASLMDRQTPVTLENYLKLGYNMTKLEDLSAEERANIPQVVFRQDLSELDPFETYYEEILAVVANNPKVSVAEARKMAEAFA